LPSAVQDGLYRKFVFLETFGPRAGRPHVDTLKGSKHANMKELRVDAANGVWLSPSIPRDERFFWSRETKRASARTPSIEG